jgi:hypothetical protein
MIFGIEFGLAIMAIIVLVRGKLTLVWNLAAVLPPE